MQLRHMSTKAEDITATINALGRIMPDLMEAANCMIAEESKRITSPLDYLLTVLFMAVVFYLFILEAASYFIGKAMGDAAADLEGACCGNEAFIRP